MFVIKSAVTLALLYCCYHLLLSKSTLHRANRCLLLAILMVSVAAPAVHIPTTHPVAFNIEAMMKESMPSAEAANMTADVATNMQDAAPVAPQPVVDVASVLMWIYLAGVVVLLAVRIVQLVRLVRFMRRGIRHTDYAGHTVVLFPGNVMPCSIFRYIVMSVSDYEHNRALLLAHEREHIRLGHSYDLLLLNLVTLFQWFNPFVWLLGRDLRAVHEYEADYAVISRGIDATTYQQFLVTKAVGMRLQPYVNSIGHGSLKSRIIMMYKSKTTRHSFILRTLLLLPVLTFIVAAFATPSGMLSRSPFAVGDSTDTADVKSPLIILDGQMINVDSEGNLVPAYVYDSLARSRKEITLGVFPRMFTDATLEQTEEYLANVLNIKKPDIDNLESVTAMHDTLATNRYGHNGRNGVIVINLRKRDADTSKTSGIGPN
ncbi:MAG: M56 family metallopeptidase [Bacteroidaceae bacterium]|nr:M56 family metallopeptidase [Bacteroidaceae bacterium]